MAYRRLLNEASGIFDAAVKKFWPQTRFTIDFLESKKRTTAT